MKDLKIFILIMAALAFVWLFTGGPLRPESKSGWFLNKPQQKASVKAQKQLEIIAGRKNSSVTSFSSSSRSSLSSSLSSSQSDIVLLNKRTAPHSSEPDQEYIELTAGKRNKNTVNITGWKLKNKAGAELFIGKGASFYYADAAVQPQEDIYLKPGEKAIIITGKKQLGTNFKNNKCLGLIEQFHEFVPSLNTDCPALKNENLPTDLNDQCLDYIDRIPACATILFLPHKDSSTLSLTCQNYITSNANYKSCSEKHKSDNNFYLPEWRIYLGISQEFWKKKRETIFVYDKGGNLVDSVSY